MKCSSPRRRGSLQCHRGGGGAEMSIAQLIREELQMWGETETDRPDGQTLLSHFSINTHVVVIKIVLLIQFC